MDAQGDAGRVEHVMNICFRVDASVDIGTGHVMRCLALAEALKAAGQECYFICRVLQGNLVHHIEASGYKVYTLTEDLNVDYCGGCEQDLAHARWLGTSQQQDADECSHILRALRPAWVVVDHYALDARWEGAAIPKGTKLLVVDDLADRSHVGDILVDQTHGRRHMEYGLLVPADCSLLLGAEYALLRPEFAQRREQGRKRRECVGVRKILVTLGGVDKDNVTALVMKALNLCERRFHVTIVAGGHNPHLESLRSLSEHAQYPNELKHQVDDMAALMVNADLCIGAAGATSWERCVVGLPTINLILAANQELIAKNLECAGASVNFGTMSDKRLESLARIIEEISDNPDQYKRMAESAFSVCDGLGAERVANVITGVL